LKNADALRCVRCGSLKLWRDGWRYSLFGDQIQRWLCRVCGYRFSQPSVKVNVTGKVGETLNSKKDNCKVGVTSRDTSNKKVYDSLPLFPCEDIATHIFSIVEKDLNDLLFYNSKHQVCAQKDAKNLNPTPKIENTLGVEKNHLEDIQEIKGNIVEFLVFMKRQGYAESTIRLNRIALKVLRERGANLLNPESVKDVISNQRAWSENRKRNVVNAYSLFLKIQGLNWDKPKVKISRGFPFIPKEEEIDALIASSGKKNAAFLQTLKETAMLSGEAKRLEWVNIDMEKNIITLNSPEKGSNPRIFSDLSGKLLSMLNTLPKENERLFGTRTRHSLKGTYSRARKRLAYKLGNPRLNEIHFHTLRHWKATMLYHYTKDLMLVAEFLGHREIENTRLYIQLDKQLFQNIPDDKFIIRAAHTIEEATKLGEVGFEPYVIMEGVQLFRKRK
jgi:integrase